MSDPSRTKKRTKREHYRLSQENCREMMCGPAFKGWPSCPWCIYLNKILKESDNAGNTSSETI